MQSIDFVLSFVGVMIWKFSILMEITIAVLLC